jgi:hypothetical protein
MDISTTTTTTMAQSKRQALAHFVYATMQLLATFEIAAEVSDVSVNFHGRAMRVDIATIGADGHLEQWLLGLAADPTHPRFAESVPLPGTELTPQ